MIDDRSFEAIIGVYSRDAPTRHFEHARHFLHRVSVLRDDEFEQSDEGFRPGADGARVEVSVSAAALGVIEKIARRLARLVRENEHFQGSAVDVIAERCLAARQVDVTRILRVFEIEKSRQKRRHHRQKRSLVFVRLFVETLDARRQDGRAEHLTRERVSRRPREGVNLVKQRETKLRGRLAVRRVKARKEGAVERARVLDVRKDDVCPPPERHDDDVPETREYDVDERFSDHLELAPVSFGVRDGVWVSDGEIDGGVVQELAHVKDGYRPRVKRVSKLGGAEINPDGAFWSAKELVHRRDAPREEGVRRASQVLEGLERAESSLHEHSRVVNLTIDEL